MTTSAPHRDTVAAFVDCLHAGAAVDGLTRVLAEDVALVGPFGDEPLTGRDAVIAAVQAVSRVATELVYQEVLIGETHHAALFRLRIGDTAVDGTDRIRLDADGRIAEITVSWRPLPAAVELQGRLAS